MYVRSGGNCIGSHGITIYLDNASNKKIDFSELKSNSQRQEIRYSSEQSQDLSASFEPAILVTTERVSLFLQSNSDDLLQLYARFRLLVIGKTGVGKSSLIHQHVSNNSDGTLGNSLRHKMKGLSSTMVTYRSLPSPKIHLGPEKACLRVLEEPDRAMPHSRRVGPLSTKLPLGVWINEASPDGTRSMVAAA
ncbi:hypothetical protein BDR04DRAFT_1118314 [Suillus decipiens]|nr:hypothetical protein BDR04DRAFT_1118314 [Suillus decipiens]